MRASSWPSKPEQPLVTETDGLNVKVTFAPPVSNGDVITGYNILFLAKDLSYHASPGCDSTLVEVAGQMECTVTFVELRAAPFSLEFLDTV